MDPLTEAGVAVGKELITKTTFYDEKQAKLSAH
jgi:hypothetical protein